MKNREIIFISGKLDKGGGERVISILANSFSCDNKVKIITLLSGQQEYEINSSIQIVNLSKKDKFRFLKIPYWVIALVREFKKSKKSEAVVISFIARVNTVALVANLITGLPVIVSERNDPKRDGRGFLTRMATRVLYPMADAVVFQSEYARNLFNGKIRDKSIVIPNPIGPYDLKKPEVIEKAFVNVGRLAPQKNQSMLIKAFAELLKKYPEYRLYIYGEGPLRRDLENLINRLSISEKVFLPGIVNGIHTKILECETFVLSSDYEGQSNALMEAMAIGMPCITTDLPGHEGIVNNDNAYIVRVNDVDQMKVAMMDMIDNPVMRNNLGRSAYETLLKYDSKTVVMSWSKLVEEVQVNE